MYIKRRSGRRCRRHGRRGSHKVGTRVGPGKMARTTRKKYYYNVFSVRSVPWYINTCSCIESLYMIFFLPTLLSLFSYVFFVLSFVFVESSLAFLFVRWIKCSCHGSTAHSLREGTINAKCANIELRSMMKIFSRDDSICVNVEHKCIVYTEQPSSTLSTHPCVVCAYVGCHSLCGCHYRFTHICSTVTY